MSDIVASGISKAFGEKQVLKDFTLRLREGETVSLMGESGCGKTTLLHILLGLIKPDAGEITGMPEKISAVFQEDRLCEDFSALSNVAMVLSGADRKKKAAEHLAALGLGGNLKTPVRELSGGMKRRVAIARALAADGDLLILDEAFKGLDENTKAAVMRYVKERTAGKTVLAVTHDRSEAEFFSDRVIEMKRSE